MSADNCWFAWFKETALQQQSCLCISGEDDGGPQRAQIGERKGPSHRLIERREDDHRGQHTPEWAPSAATNGSCALRECWPQLRRQGGNAAHVARSPQLNSWMLSCTSDPCGGRDTRTAHSVDITFSARRWSRWSSLLANSRTQSWKRRPRLLCCALKDQTTRHAMDSAGWTRMGQGFAPSRSPSVGNSTVATQTLLREAAQMARIAAATEPLNPDDMETQQFPPNLAARLAVCEWAKLNMAVDAKAPLWIEGCGVKVLFIWSGICLRLHRQLALAHEFQNSSGSNDRNRW